MALGLVAAVLAIASPASAVPIPGAVQPAAGGQPDLVMSGTAQGRGGISGALAPSTFDPLSGYPAAPPSGSVDKDVGFAGLITATPVPAGPELLLYCIDINTPTSPGVKYERGTWDEATVPNVGYVARLLNDYFPNTSAPTSLADANDKAAAVQAAIWFFSDKYVLDAGQARRSQVAAMVGDIIAKGPLENPAPPSLTITPAEAEGPVGSTIGPFTVNTTSPATVSATGGTLFADAAGAQPLTNPVQDGTQLWAQRPAEGPVDIQAVAVAEVPSGNVYLPIGQQAQKLILARTGTLQTKATANATAFDVGALEVVKTLTGPGEPQRSAVALAVRCSDGSTGAVIHPAGTPPTPLRVEGIRAGSSCTVIEVVDGANQIVEVTTVISPAATVTVPTNSTTTDTTTIEVTNDYRVRTGSLRVTKVITGSEADQRGDVVIDVACDGGTTATFTFPAGEEPTPQTVSDLPVGSECTVTETDDGGDPPTVVVETTIVPAGPITTEADHTVDVVVSDLYGSGVGSLVVLKQTEGLDELRGEIVVDVSCDDGSTVSQAYPTGSASPPIVLDGLPLGTQCTVEESATGASDLVDVTTVVEPDQPVTIGEPDAPTVVRVTNTYTPRPGEVTVDKAIAGPGAGLHGPVVLVLACENGALELLAIPAGDPGPGSVTITDVPAGTDCGVAELRDGSTPEVTATVAGLPEEGFLVLPAEQRTISVVNTYELNAGALEVIKVIDGEYADFRDDITVTVSCSNGARATATYAPGVAPAPALLDGLPAGTTCRVEEPDDGAVPGVGDITNGAPQTVTILPGRLLTATVTNTFVDVLASTPTPILPVTGASTGRLGSVGLALVVLGAAILVIAAGPPRRGTARRSVPRRSP